MTESRPATSDFANYRVFNSDGEEVGRYYGWDSAITASYGWPKSCVVDRVTGATYRTWEEEEETS